MHNASQEEVYKTCTSGILKKALDGYNNTLFVYGQTGAGKTYTITGLNFKCVSLPRDKSFVL